MKLTPRHIAFALHDAAPRIHSGREFWGLFGFLFWNKTLGESATAFVPFLSRRYLDEDRAQTCADVVVTALLADSQSCGFQKRSG